MIISIRSTVAQLVFPLLVEVGCANSADSKSNLKEQIPPKLNSLGINWYVNLPSVVNPDGYDGFCIKVPF